jgi:hypothetical protein
MVRTRILAESVVLARVVLARKHRRSFTASLTCIYSQLTIISLLLSLTSPDISVPLLFSVALFFGACEL